MTVIVVKSVDEVVAKLCEKITEISNESISRNGAFHIGLSGGSLVNFLQSGLPNISTDFSKWKIFFCDERVVPENDPDSTYGVYKSLTKTTSLKLEQFVAIKQGVSADEAALDYRQKMAQIFGDSLPKFDLLLLGMGPDGHTCSLFPGHALLEETSKWVASITDSPKPPPARITLTFPVLNNARNCIFALSGKEKAEAIRNIFGGKGDLPAGRIKLRDGELCWILDENAAQKLEK